MEYMRQTCYIQPTNEEQGTCIDPNSVNSEFKTIAENFVCSICLNISLPMAQCSNCDSITCFSCSKKYNRCTTRCAGRMIRISRRMESAILKIKVVCNNKNCSSIIAIEEYNKHKNECLFEVVNCTNNCCKYSGPRGTIRNHALKCEFLQKMCTFCYSYFVQKEHVEHEKVCPEKKAICPYNKDCKNIYNKNLEKHKKECPYKKVSCNKCELEMFQKDVKNHDCILQLKNEIKSLKSNYEMLEKRISMIEGGKKEKENIKKIEKIEVLGNILNKSILA